jgi:plastocyanin
MKLGIRFFVFVALLLAAGQVYAAPQAANTGTIKGHIRLQGKLPGNPVIRMGRDPKCAQANRGKLVVQETVMAALDGSLADVFVRLQGTFPATPVPTTPVVVDQVNCIYRPRVIGMRVGQTLQLKNSDNFLHNVHSLSKGADNFNVAQPVAGLVYSYKPKQEEVMLPIKCEVHSWMNLFVGVVNNPYFAVTPASGNYQIDRVPAGTYTIQAWQEHYGFVSKMVTVRPGAVTTVNFTYTEAPAPAKPAPGRPK